MKLRVSASNGTSLLVWREDDTYCARREGTAIQPEVCLAVDLFEVIAELAGLDLDRDDDASEAIRLAEYAQTELNDHHLSSRDNGDDDTPAESTRTSR
jgi:hypothetical protein